MAYRYEFREAAARDLSKLTRRNHDLLHAVVIEHIPRILKDPLAVGRPKKGDLFGMGAYDLTFRSVAYRLVFEVEGDVLFFIAVGPHDEAYRRASRR